MLTENQPILTGYEFNQQLYDGAKSQVYRAVRIADQTRVVIKLFKDNHPSFKTLTQFRHQYDIVQNIDLPGIVHPITLEPYQNRFALIMPDHGSIDLHRFLASTILDLDIFFAVALQLADILEGLHAQACIHKDIKPANILIHPQTHTIQLIDFSIASRLSQENQSLASLNQLEGTLDYIAPEQTGRMNRGIDYRTDFYSLGVSFYEMLTAQLPFHSDDPLEIVYGHLAKQAQPPMRLNPLVPAMVNDIVLKLMAKNAEDRYQSGAGLRVDLTRCQTHWQNKQNIAPFTLGQGDLARTFAIPEKLYGRAEEVQQLLNAFDKTTEGQTALVLIAGHSGMGKTALVSEVHKPITREAGYFIQGKFDQFNHDTPYSALSQALTELIEHLLDGDEAQQSHWRQKILSAVAEQGRVLVDVIPALSQLIGQQPAVTQLHGEADANRFNYIFQAFIALFTTKEHPLTLFLDDLQWIDPASLKLLSSLLQPTAAQALLLIGAYRDNEVQHGHPLNLALKGLQNTPVNVITLTLNALTEPELNQLIADTCRCNAQQALALTHSVYEKTQGNPFFIHQFLRLLKEEALVTFDFTHNHWTYHLSRIQQLAASNDVLEFVTSQLRKLPDNTQHLLQLAACIGNTFHLSTLAAVAQEPMANCVTALLLALKNSLITPQDNCRLLFQNPDSPYAAQDTLCHFTHDRVQQAAYALIASEEKAAIHMRIGRLLQETGTHDTPFDIVNQFNLGVALISDPQERLDLTQLNLQAGHKAQLSTAYHAASDYYTNAINLLPNDAWTTHYTLTLNLYEAMVETAFLHGDYAQQARWSKNVLTHAKTVIDTLKTQIFQCHKLNVQSKQLEAVMHGLPVLKQLGIVLPEQADADSFQAEYDKTQTLLAGRSAATLTNLPLITDKQAYGTLQLLHALASPLYSARPDLFALSIFKQVQLFIEYGNAPEAIPCYASYGFILSQVIGDIQQGAEFGLLAQTLLDQMHANQHKAHAYIAIYCAIRPWKFPLKDTLAPFMSGYQAGRAYGDPNFGSGCLLWHCVYAYFCGTELSTLDKTLDTCRASIRELHQKNVLFCTDMLQQAIINLRTPSKTPSRLEGAIYSVTENLPKHTEGNDQFALAQLHVQQLILSYLFRDISAAQQFAEQAAGFLSGVLGSFFIAIHNFYASLTLLAGYTDTAEAEQAAILSQVTSNQAKMAHWAKHAPMNFEHKWALVEAEKCRLCAHPVDAMGHYDQAITGAQTHGYPQEEALANELAARFYLDWNKPTIAQAYMTNAYYAYARWGASAKVHDLENTYPTLLNTVPQTPVSPDINASINQTTDMLDLGTVMKSTQALSSELSLTKLLKNMLDIVMENAGARRTVLLLLNDGLWQIAGEGNIDEETETILPQTPLDDASDLPASLIQHIIQKQHPVVLDDAREAHQRFHQDPYFQQKPNLKSVLCLPIRAQGKLTGLLYLENALVIGAFPEERQKILQILAAQAAISLENALLYEGLEAKVKQRTAQLQEKNKRIHESLVYASSMQLSLLPSAAVLAQAFQRHFVIWEPRDVVGGDIYFCTVFPDGCIVTLIDCTGHGVPGAFMSMIAGSAFASIPLERYLNDPASILKLVNRFVTKTLQQAFQDAKSDNGMDMGVCCIHYSSASMTYAGAKFSLLCVTDEHVQELKGDRKSLGYKGSNTDFTFTNHTLTLQPKAAYYLCSDGFVDQAGGPKRFGFGIRRFHTMLQTHHQQPFAEQKRTYLTALNQYQGDIPRYDDITMLGFGF